MIILLFISMKDSMYCSKPNITYSNICSVCPSSVYVQSSWLCVLKKKTYHNISHKSFITSILEKWFLQFMSWSKFPATFLLTLSWRRRGLSVESHTLFLKFPVGMSATFAIDRLLVISIRSVGCLASMLLVSSACRNGLTKGIRAAQNVLASFMSTWERRQSLMIELL